MEMAILEEMAEKGLSPGARPAPWAAASPAAVDTAASCLPASRVGPCVPSPCPPAAVATPLRASSALWAVPWVSERVERGPVGVPLCPTMSATRPRVESWVTSSSSSGTAARVAKVDARRSREAAVARSSAKPLDALARRLARWALRRPRSTGPLRRMPPPRRWRRREPPAPSLTMLRTPSTSWRAVSGLPESSAACMSASLPSTYASASSTTGHWTLIVLVTGSEDSAPSTSRA
mmetsp:Transcript_38498/g.121931  ORF Transcript_38498/g.121931 Transcript_38498/m.121931 type:complete len:235 (+) Transcript_38498:497-1201(+)